MAITGYIVDNWLTYDRKYRKRVKMAFDPHLTVEHGLAVSHDIDNVLDKAELDPTTSETIKKVAGHVRYYADLEVENILSDIEDLRSQVANIPIIDDPEIRLCNLEDGVDELVKQMSILKDAVALLAANKKG